MVEDIRIFLVIENGGQRYHWNFFCIKTCPTVGGNALRRRSSQFGLCLNSAPTAHTKCVTLEKLFNLSELISLTNQ